MCRKLNNSTEPSFQSSTLNFIAFCQAFIQTSSYNSDIFVITLHALLWVFLLSTRQIKSLHEKGQIKKGPILEKALCVAGKRICSWISAFKASCNLQAPCYWWDVVRAFQGSNSEMQEAPCLQLDILWSNQGFQRISAEVKFHFAARSKRGC